MGPELLSYMGDRRAAKDRRNILNQSFADTQKATDKATKLVLDEGANYQADARQKAMMAQEEAAFGQATQDLQGATGGAGATLDTAGDAGNTSGAFVRAKADRALQEGGRMTAIARELAKTRAPGLTRQIEGQRGADVMQQTGSIWGSAKNMGRAAQLDAEAVQEPWWGTLGKIAKQAANAYASGGGAGL